MYKYLVVCGIYYIIIVVTVIFIIYTIHVILHNKRPWSSSFVVCTLYSARTLNYLLSYIYSWYVHLGICLYMNTVYIYIPRVVGTYSRDCRVMEPRRRGNNNIMSFWTNRYRMLLPRR